MDLLKWLEENWERIWPYVLVLLGIAVTVFIALFVKALMRRSLGRRMPKHAYSPLEKLVYYGLIVVGVIYSLKPLGLNLTGLLMAGGVLGIVIGFASQAVVSNLLGGLFIYIERPMKIGDPVEIEGVGGEVLDISVLSTRIRTWDGYVVRLPNSRVFNAHITNYAAIPARRIDFAVSIAYGSDIPAAREAIMGALRSHPLVLENPEPEVYVEELGDSAIVLRVRAWAPTKVWFPVKKELVELVYRTLVERGFEIPFPQMDVHLK